jgi:thiol-disulfide isomerase/thioredoxin
MQDLNSPAPTPGYAARRSGPTWVFSLGLPVIFVATYVAVAGSTGCCRACTAIVDAVPGRSASSTSGLRGATATLAGLTATDLAGNAVDLAAKVGQPMVLDFWATWCPPCREQRRVLHELPPDLAGELRVLALSVDDSPVEVREFIARESGDSHTASAVASAGASASGKVEDLMASPATAQAFGVSSIPTLVFVDARGQVRGVEAGVHTADDLRAWVQRLR